MATGREVLEMLAAEAEWVIIGDDFDSIEWIKGKPITKAQFEAGFDAYDNWKIQKDAEVAVKKLSTESKLAALGLDAEDLKVLGLG